MAKAKPFYYAVLKDSLRSDHSNNHKLWNFIDMLRYDGAKVNRSESEFFVLESNNHPVVARWQSFHIPVWGITRDAYETIDRTRADASSLLNS